VPAAASILTTARRIPWARVLFAARLVYRKGSAAARALTESERSRLLELVKKSRGRPSNLTERERRRVRDLAAKALDAARKA
jgi:hypothetical protein